MFSFLNAPNVIYLTRDCGSRDPIPKKFFLHSFSLNVDGILLPENSKSNKLCFEVPCPILFTQSR